MSLRYNGVRLRLPQPHLRQPNGVELTLVTESGRLRAVDLTLPDLLKLAEDATHILKVALERGDIWKDRI